MLALPAPGGPSMQRPHQPAPPRPPPGGPRPPLGPPPPHHSQPQMQGQQQHMQGQQQQQQHYQHQQQQQHLQQQQRPPMGMAGMGMDRLPSPMMFPGSAMGLPPPFLHSQQASGRPFC